MRTLVLRETFFSLLLLCLFSMPQIAKASHLYGGDLFYTHISGNKYKVTMVLYGDCGGTPSVFAALYTATPEVVVYNGSSVYRTMSLKVLPGAGTEVTPICASSLGSTVCNGGTVPGVKRFEYADTITLAPSSSWRLKSNGNLTSASIAGRSNTITNISGPGTTIMSLEATLNNSSAANSNPSFTTIPTPFFCINVDQEYNQGAVDPNLGDSLVYTLVDGLDASVWPPTTVSYLSGYSATSPLATAAGSFSFNKSTGQLSFNPNRTQVSLVVCKVSEYRSGVLVGTCMREMNFIVLSTCSNHSPYGKISSVTGGKATSNTGVEICKNENALSFYINPTDADGNNITVSYAGLPIGATLSVSGSGTSTPSCFFSWDISTISAGSYNFYITYQDDACPLSSKQTVVYTINILPKATFSFNTISDISCVQKAVFEVTPSPSLSSWTLQVLSGSTTLHSIASSASTQRDSVTTGSYIIKVTNSNGCYDELPYTVLAPPKLYWGTCSTSMPTCNRSSNGLININAVGGRSPYVYQINGGTFVSAGSFSGLSAGTYNLKVRDANNCTADTSIVLTEPTKLILTANVKKPLCKDRSDGGVNLSAIGGVGLYSYSIGSGIFSGSNYFSALSSGIYTFTVKDSNNCTATTTVTLVDSVVVSASSIIKNVSCFGSKDGSITLIPSSGKNPYYYALGAGGYGTSATFSSLYPGTYNINIKDSFGCSTALSATVAQPTKLNITATIINVTCNGLKDGIITLFGSGGTAPYNFSFDSSIFSTKAIFNGLGATKYKITIKDANGCTIDTFMTVNEPPPLYINTIITKPLCQGDDNGTVTVTASGGTASYTYAKSDGIFQPDSVLRNFKSGSYLVQVKDAKGCIKDTFISINEPSKLIISTLKILNPTCENYKDGVIAIKARGGTTPYNYSLDNVSYVHDSIMNHLSESTYTIYVRDSNNCLVDTSIALKGYPKIKLDSLLTTPTLCNGSDEGKLQLFASGGNPPLRYVFEQSGDTMQFASYQNLKAKKYTITVIDTTNCIKKFDADVFQPEILDITTQIVHNDCTGNDSNGSIMAMVQGGTAPYQYLWSWNKDTVATIRNLPNGFYKLWIIDNNGCKDSLQTEVYFDNCCTPSIPNAFTPNGDGKNDVFRLMYTGDIELKEFSIYNRYGQKVFSTNNKEQGWNGKFNGQDEELGVYYYMLRIICGNLKNKEVFMKGDVTLIR